MTGNELDRAADGKADGSWMDKASEKFAMQLIERGVEGVGPLGAARDAADKALRENKGDPNRAVKDIVSGAARSAAVGGFVTGLGGFITLPVALPANIVEFYLVATRMVAQIAHVRGYDTSKPEVRTAILLTLVGTEAPDVLAKVGRVSTGTVTSLATRGLPDSALMVVNKAVAFRLISKVGGKVLTKFGKFVPVIGGALGAGLDNAMMRRVAKNADQNFPMGGAR